MLTVFVPEAPTDADYAELLAEIKAEPEVWDGVKYYPDGLGGMHREDPEGCAKTVHAHKQFLAKEWADLARRLR